MMEYVVGGVIGVVITFVGFVAVMAPIHWENYHEAKQLKEDNRLLVEERDHFMSLVRPNEWGPQAQHAARIVPKVKPWEEEATTFTAGVVEYLFDDVKNGGDK